MFDLLGKSSKRTSKVLPYPSIRGCWAISCVQVKRPFDRPFATAKLSGIGKGLALDDALLGNKELGDEVRKSES